MNTVIKFPGAGAPISKPIGRGSNVSTNRRSGYVICWRSLMAADWAKSAVKFAGWMRLISLAAYEECAVSYKGREWTLMRGQLVISTTELGTLLRDERGRALSKQATDRLLGWFEREGMVSIQGTPWGSVITVNNYDDYQAAVMAVDTAEPAPEKPAPIEQKETQLGGVSVGTPTGTLTGTHTETLKAAPDMGLSDTDNAPSGVPIGVSTGTTTEQEINTLKENTKISSSKNADALPDAEAAESVSAAVEKIRPDAAIQTPSGKFWGTQDDLTCAEYIHSRVLVVNPTAKAPNWAQWANDIRLMRTQLGYTHHDICSLFKWANLDQFWSANVLCPKTLRKQWDKLQAKRNAAPPTSKRPLSNIAAAQQQARSLIESGAVSYDDDTPL